VPLQHKSLDQLQQLLNAFSVVLSPIITISTNHVSATSGTAITPVTITNTGSGIYSYSISPAISNGLSAQH
jgi:hypothetical protein